MLNLLRQINWRNHRASLARLFVSLLLLAIALFFYIDNASALKNATVSYASQITSSEEAELLKVVLDDNLDDYKALLQHGYLGAPQRLQWLEVLRRLVKNHELPGVDFTLESSQITEKGVDPFWHPAVAMRSTEMRLLMQLSHEGDLYKLLDGLQNQALGLFTVDDCQLQWNMNYSEDMALSRLRADCRLKWYTLIDVTESWEAE